MLSFTKKILGDLFAVLIGALLLAAFAPTNLYPLGVLCPALLLMLWINTSPKRIFWRSWLFGVGLFGFGVCWVYLSIHIFGQAPAITAAMITAIFIGGLSLFPACHGYLLKRFFSGNKIFLAFPATWVLFEWLRTWLFTGFPWLLLGYSQINSPLRGYAPLFSVYGVSLITATTSSLLIAGITVKKTHTRIIICLTILSLWIMGWQLNFISWTKSVNKSLAVALVQGKIPQSTKWIPEQAAANLRVYWQLTQQHWNSDIIVWPEAGITYSQQDAAKLIKQFSQTAKQYHTTIITGIPIVNGFDYYNGMIAIGENEGTYLKRHLVPFGEYFPLKFLWGPLFKDVVIPMSDMTPGPKNQPDLFAKGIVIGPSICYEIAYAHEIAESLPKAQLLVTISDDSWFGESTAQAQQLQMTQMRALETGRYALASTNDGLTAIINDHGEIVSQAPPYQRYVLTGNVQPKEGETPWIKWGIFPLLIIILVMIIFS